MNWIGRVVRLPKPLRQGLEALFGASVAHVRIFEYSPFARLHGRAIATTRRGRIYLRGSATDFFQDPWLVLHEYCHVIRQWDPRNLTVWAYLAECVRKGYWNNRFEVEARAFADAHALRLRHLLAGRGVCLTPAMLRGRTGVPRF